MAGPVICARRPAGQMRPPTVGDMGVICVIIR